MKKNFGLILATMLATAVMAQTPPPAAPSTPPPLPAAPDTTAPPTTPPPLPPEAGSPGTNAPAKAKKKSTKKKTTTSTKKKESPKAKASKSAASIAPAEPLVPGEPAVARQNNVNMRGQARINSEVVGHLKKGEVVTVLEEVTVAHPKTDEPSKWAKITLPGNMKVWANTSFIDKTNQTVSARKLNLRTGPGENYSVIGLLHKGDAVKTVNTKGDWTQIEAPTNCYAFVAAHLLTHKAPEAAPPPPVQPQPTPAIVSNPAPLAPPPGAPPAVPPPAIQLPPVAPPPPPAAEEPPPKRIIEREGIVGNTVSIQAPSHFELKSLDDGSLMDYLYTTSTNLPLKRYKGLTVLVTGEEELDERWPNTPVLTIQKIQVIK